MENNYVSQFPALNQSIDTLSCQDIMPDWNSEKLPKTKKQNKPKLLYIRATVLEIGFTTFVANFFVKENAIATVVSRYCPKWYKIDYEEINPKPHKRIGSIINPSPFYTIIKETPKC